MTVFFATRLAACNYLILIFLTMINIYKNYKYRNTTLLTLLLDCNVKVNYSSKVEFSFSNLSYIFFTS